jgi:hypothetical protein
MGDAEGERATGPLQRLRRRSSPRLRPVARVAVAALLLPLLFSPGDSPGASDDGYLVNVAASEGTDGGAPMDQPQGATVTGPDRVVDARPVVAESVDTRQPHLLVRTEEPIGHQELFAVLSLPEVEHLASTALVELSMTVGDRRGALPDGGEADEDGPDEVTVRILAVDPAAFRPFTPDATAQSAAVWERLLDGELVVRHDVAQEHQLPLGGTVLLTGRDGDGSEVRIGAFASNGSPPFADAIVPWSTGRELGITAPNQLILSISEDEDPGTSGESVAEVVPGAEVEVIEPPEVQQAAEPSSEFEAGGERAQLVGDGSYSFEPFSYVSHGDGMITIDPDWVRRNIVTVELPIFGGVARCHRVMVPQLLAALREVQAAGLDRHIDPRDYGGCWVPRHIMFNPSRSLSMHAWGLAVDFNVSTNQYGAQPQMHPGIVEIFERWGFSWGGYWSTPDGMHFELRTVVDP